LKTLLVFALVLLSGCSWFHRKPPAPISPEFIVTGAPAGSIVFVDDVQKGQLTEFNDKPQIITVVEGEHKVEVRIGDTVVYRENAFIKSAEKRVITVLSGSNRE
jgi:hypothetical protein